MATQINIKNIPEGYQSIISNGRHTVIGDEPIKSKGTDLGFSPVDFLLAGISMCKAATIRNVARRNGWKLDDVNAELTQVVKRQKDGSLVTTVESKVDIKGDITEEQYAKLIYEADNCYVTRMVKGDWDFKASKPIANENAMLVQ